jgi:HK97 family phage prohead protease
MTVAIEDRAAIAAHSTATSDGAWDGGANERRLREGESADYYAEAYAWRDSSGDGTVKADYSFIHHEVAGNGDVGPANMTACSTGIGVLNGGRLRPGTRPKWAGDRQGIWRHLARHLEDDDKTPPPLRERSGGLDIERRGLVLEQLRVERRQADGPPHIVGHAAVFNKWSDPLGFGSGGFREIIRTGAFTKTLKEADVRGLFNHNPDYVLGRTKSGTLLVQEDDTGLAFDAEPPATQWAHDLLVSVDRGDIDQGSFSFMAIKDAWGTSTEGGETFPSRELTEAALSDVSVVTFPAYPQTDVGLRSLLAAAGLQWEPLAEALSRCGPDGEARSADDREIIESTIELLREYVPAEPEPGLHSEVEQSGEAPGRLTVLRRRLDVLDRTCI